MKILTIVGARPQFIKAAVINRVLRNKGGVTEVMLHTGQHYDEEMSKIFFDELEIPKPKYNLGINDMPAAQMTGVMIEKIHEVMQKEKPDCVLVFGDTNSTLAGAIAAKQNHIALGHIEAGLRCFDITMPEEFNRVITDRISDYLFCPTDTSIGNLRKEGFENFNCKLVMSGDVMYDAALYYQKVAEEKSEIIRTIEAKDFGLATLHRAENVDNPATLTELVNALNEINKKLKIVLPIHPRTKKKITETGLRFSFDTINPVGYLDMIQLLSNCNMVLTDSGGLQKEAFFFKKPCITLRNNTEWTELVDHGFNMIGGIKKETVLAAFETMAERKLNFDKHFYGKGKAGEFIVDSMLTSA